MGNGLGDLPTILSAASATNAIRALARGDVEAAYKTAVNADARRLKKSDRKQLGCVFYAHGKLLTSNGDVQSASRDFRRAVGYDGDNETFRLRNRWTTHALRESRQTEVERRLLIMKFCQEMTVRQNVPLSNLPRAAFLHVAQRAQSICPPIVPLPEAIHLDRFDALGTYRWQGDAKSGDLFTRWVRDLKAGKNATAIHLGRLLADWVWSGTDALADIDYVVPVPGEPQRQRDRGFNAPGILAEAIQDTLGVPILTNALVRNRSLRSRDAGSYAEVRECFGPGRSACKVDQRSVLLLDDVATRGYTLRACSQVLRTSGARRVVCVVLAQSISTLRESRALED